MAIRTQYLAALNATLFVRTDDTTQYATVYKAEGKLDVGSTGPDWTPRANTKFCASLMVKGPSRYRGFGSTPQAALEALYDNALIDMVPVATLRARRYNEQGPKWTCSLTNGDTVSANMPNLVSSFLLGVAILLKREHEAKEATAAAMQMQEAGLMDYPADKWATARAMVDGMARHARESKGYYLTTGHGVYAICLPDGSTAFHGYVDGTGLMSRGRAIEVVCQALMA